MQVADEGLACESRDWQVTSTHVKHGPNALGYRIDAGGKSVTISGDIAVAAAGTGPVRYIDGFPCESIERLAKDTDLFIVDACGRHNPPEELAAAIARANPKKVVLSHVQNTASARVNQEQVRKAYKGEVIIAENLKRIPV